MTACIEVVTVCPHGLDRKHPTNFWDGVQIDCDGGSRRVLDARLYRTDVWTKRTVDRINALALEGAEALAGGDSS